MAAREGEVHVCRSGTGWARPVRIPTVVRSALYCMRRDQLRAASRQRTCYLRSSGRRGHNDELQISYEDINTSSLI